MTQCLGEGIRRREDKKEYRIESRWSYRQRERG